MPLRRPPPYAPSSSHQGAACVQLNSCCCRPPAGGLLNACSTTINSFRCDQCTSLLCMTLLQLDFLDLSSYCITSCMSGQPLVRNKCCCEHCRNRHFRLIWSCKAGKAQVLNPTNRFATAAGGPPTTLQNMHNNSRKLVAYVVHSHTMLTPQRPITDLKWW